MANKKYKLTDGNYWATDGIHDFGQNKTQREINAALVQADSDLSGALTSVKQDFATPVWTIGSLNTSNGTEATATNQIRSNYIRCKTGTRIACASGYQFIVCMYNADTYTTYIGSSGSWQSTEYVLANDRFIRILLRRSDQTTVSNASDISGNIFIGDAEIGQHNALIPIANGGTGATTAREAVGALIGNENFYSFEVGIPKNSHKIIRLKGTSVQDYVVRALMVVGGVDNMNGIYQINKSSIGSQSNYSTLVAYSGPSGSSVSISVVSQANGGIAIEVNTTGLSYYMYLSFIVFFLNKELDSSFPVIEDVT